MFRLVERPALMPACTLLHSPPSARSSTLMALASRHLALILCSVFAAGFVAGRCWQLVALVETSLRKRLGQRAARKAIPY